MTESSPDSTGKLAAIYARVSTDDQGRGYSLPTQIEACQQLAQEQGYTVYNANIFQDELTGSVLNRPGLNQLRELVRTRHVQAVIVHDLDRLSRRLAHQLLIDDECREHDVKLHIVTMPEHADTPEAQLLRHVRGSIAEYERLKIAERTTRGIRGRAQAGHVGGGQVPLGYKPVREAHKGRWEIQPGEAALVKRIYKLAATGVSCRAIAWQLSREKVPTRKDRQPGYGGHKLAAKGTWSQSTVHKILTNTCYSTGLVQFGDVTTTDGQGTITVPTIIDPETYFAVQEQLKANFRTARRNRKLNYLLSGHLFCGLCGKRMLGYNSSGRTNAHRRYRCNSVWNLPPDQRCRGTAKAEDIEAEVWAAVERALHNPEMIASEVEKHQGDADEQLAELDRQQRVLQTAMEKYDRQVQRWHDAYANDVINLEEYKMRRAEVEETRQVLQHELEMIDAHRDVIHQAKAQVEQLTAYCARVRSRLRKLTYDEQRIALSALDVHVDFAPNQPLDITGVIPLDIVASTTGQHV
jgi:site-specific DNA recombinase